jgi:hypothetical protein
MKIYLQSSGLVSESVKYLQRTITEVSGKKFPHAQAKELLAKVLGFKNFHELKHSPVDAPPSLLDYQLTTEELTARRRRQAQLLSASQGYDFDLALSIINKARPSDTRRALHSTISEELFLDLCKALMPIKWHRGREPGLDALVNAHVVKTLSKPIPKRYNVGPETTLDRFMSVRLPHYVEELRLVDLDNPFGGEVVETERRAADATGWATLTRDLIHPLKATLADMEPTPWRPAATDSAKLWQRLKDHLNANDDNVCDILEKNGTLASVADFYVTEYRKTASPKTVTDAVIRVRNAHGFYEWYPLIENDETFVAEMWRPLRHHPRDHKEADLTSGSMKIKLKMTRERQGDERGDRVAFHFVTATASINDRPIAVLKGELITCKSDPHISDRDLYFQAESKGGDITHLIHIILTEHMSADELLYESDLFYLSHWEKAADADGHLAADFLRTVVTDLKRRHKRLRSLAFEAHPLQFPHPFANAFPEVLHQHFQSARSKLQHRLYDVLGPLFETIIEIDITEEHENLSDNLRARYLTAREMGKGTPSNPAIKIPFRRFEFPDGWSGFIWQTTKYWEPHPRFWDRMPADLISLDVDFQNNEAPGCIVQQIRFTFDNGTSFSMDVESFLNPDGVPPELARSKINPFTDSVAPTDLLWILRLNSSLLFTQTPNDLRLGGTSLKFTRYPSPKWTTTEEKPSQPQSHIPRQPAIKRQYVGPIVETPFPEEPMNLAPYRFNQAYTTHSLKQLLIEIAEKNLPDRVVELALKRLPWSQMTNSLVETSLKLEESATAFQENGCITVNVHDVISDAIKVGSLKDVGAAWPRFLKNRDAFYLSFGEHKYPSPHEDSFVDGCYLIRTTAGGFHLFFTCTMDVDLLDDNAPLDALCEQHSRGFHFMILTSQAVSAHEMMAPLYLPSEWLPYYKEPFRVVAHTLATLDSDTDVSLTENSGIVECPMLFIERDRVPARTVMNFDAPIIFARPIRTRG